MGLIELHRMITEDLKKKRVFHLAGETSSLGGPIYFSPDYSGATREGPGGLDVYIREQTAGRRRWISAEQYVELRKRPLVSVGIFDFEPEDSELIGLIRRCHDNPRGAAQEIYDLRKKLEEFHK